MRVTADGKRIRLTVKDLLKWLALCICGVAINLVLSRLCEFFEIPLYLDSVGTILTAFIGGSIPGIAVGIITNVVKSLSGSGSSIYYGSLNVMIAVTAAWFASKKNDKKYIVPFILMLTGIGGVLGSFITWYIYGFGNEGVSAFLAKLLYENVITGNSNAAQLAADIIIDLCDKSVTVALALLVFKFIPASFCDRLRHEGWQQKPLSKSERKAVEASDVRQVSLRTKLMALITVGMIFIAIAAIGIGFVLFWRNNEDFHSEYAKNIAEFTTSVIDADRIDEFIEKGEELEEYRETKEVLQKTLESSSEIEFLYVYKIEKNGCRVVFDTDTKAVKGSVNGDLIPFDDDFEGYMDKLYAGEEIDPVVCESDYGWLLTLYEPIKDSSGKTVCYVGIDIDMGDLTHETMSFVVKQLSLFLGFFIMVLAVGVWVADYNIVYPLNTMSRAAHSFAFDSKDARHQSVVLINSLDIHTGDEIENLYKAIASTTVESMQYVGEIKKNARKIEELQSGLIIVLADMVENRDKNTGDHIKNTASYTELILKKLKSDGSFGDILTDRFISNVIKSAPLHDVGKINVSDAILNKPARLTDEEYEIMKKHAEAGYEIIQHAIDLVSQSGYLEEAKNLAHYHHEKWDGSGYPDGLKGEEIPLSARVMAVADVFDALVSKRAYKEPFPIEKALDIIREGSGTHFDPTVASAFLACEDQIREIVKRNNEKKQ